MKTFSSILAYSFLFFLLSCNKAQEVATHMSSFQSQIERKQKQKIALFYKKLQLAEHSLIKEQEEVEHLRSYVSDAELDLIELQLSSIEKKWQSEPKKLIESLSSMPELFLTERETLYRVIQKGFSIPRAQALLDRILQLITQVSDSSFN